MQPSTLQELVYSFGSDCALWWLQFCRVSLWD